MSIETNAPARRKPVAVGSQKYRAPHPGASKVPAALDTSSAARAVYVGRDRLGSYHRAGGAWVAEDRLGRPLGRFSDEFAAANAIIATARGGR